MGIAKTAGRKTRRFKALRKQLRDLGLPCYLCGNAIDYTKTAPHPDSFTVEHVKPRSKYPELAEDPGNLKSAHFGCNNAKGVREDEAGHGMTSKDW